MPLPAAWQAQVFRGLAGAAPKSPCGRHLPRCLSVLLEFLRAPSALFKGLKMGSGRGGGERVSENYCVER